MSFHANDVTNFAPPGGVALQDELEPGGEQQNSEALAFLSSLYPDGSVGYLNLWTRAAKRSNWYAANNLSTAANDLSRLNETGCVWFQTGLTVAPLGPDKRGREADVVAVPGVHCDIDVLDPAAHKRGRLPPTLADALALIRDLRITPTLVVSSGHGLQPHWLFGGAIKMECEGDRTRAKAVQVRLQSLLRRIAACRRWEVDSTADLVRLLRIPGTINRKPNCVPVPVAVLERHGRRYTLAELEGLLADRERELELDQEGHADGGDGFGDHHVEPDRTPALSPAADTPPATRGEQADGCNDEKAEGTGGDDVLIRRARQADNGEKFCRLFDCGDESGYPSRSEAVQALLSMLAFYTRDRTQIERVASRSHLCGAYEKWDRPDFRDASIGKALAFVTSAAEGTATGTDAGSKKAAEGEKVTVSQALVRLASGAELFHNGDDVLATVDCGTHRETHLIRRKGFKRWLQHRYWKTTGRTASSQAVQDAVETVAASALYEGVESAVAVRVGEHGGAVYVDLCDDRWRAVRVTAEGWEVVSNPPVKFVRRDGMRALPMPERGGSLSDLRGLVNASDDKTFVLAVSWLVGSLCPRGPYPILSVNGEQGSAKTTTCRVLRALVDPNDGDLSEPPKDRHDLMIAATNAWVVGFDNLSSVSGDLSDSLCRIATGAAMRTRELYSNDGERIFKVSRPVILNGIGELSSRPDLVERSVMLNLPHIPASGRQTEADVWRRFGELHPRLLGALLDAVSVALRNHAVVATPDGGWPRMADFSRWVVAAEPGLPWTAGRFLNCYRSNQDEGSAAAVENSAIGPAVLTLVERSQGRWEGGIGELHGVLHGGSNDLLRSRHDWPKTPAGLSSMLKRVAPGLRKIGVEVTFLTRSKSGQRIVLSRVGEAGYPEGVSCDTSWKADAN